MKNLIDLISINENKLEFKDVTQYISTLISNCLSDKDYNQLINNILKGLERGAKDNIRFYKGFEAVAAKKFLKQVQEWQKNQK